MLYDGFLKGQGAMSLVFFVIGFYFLFAKGIFWRIIASLFFGGLSFAILSIWFPEAQHHVMIGSHSFRWVEIISICFVLVFLIKAKNK